MFFFTLFYRSTLRHGFYAGLTIGGLALGIATLLVLVLYVRFETGFEDWIGNRDQIYLIKTKTHFPNSPQSDNPTTMGGLLDILRADDAGLVGTRLWDNDIVIHRGAERVQEHEKLVDADFFATFKIKLAAGDAATALAGPDRIVVTEAVARRYFPGQQALGQVLQIGDSGTVKSYRISAILQDLPTNTDFTFDFIRLLTPDDYRDSDTWNRYGSEQLATYLAFPTEAAAQAFERRLTAILDEKAANAFDGAIPHTRLEWHLAPLSSLHLADRTTRLSVWAMGGAGLLAFFLAVINYLNLATARASLRAREVAIMKSLGATRWRLIGQFLGEGLLTMLIATLVSISLVEVFLPLINLYGGQTLTLAYGRDYGWILALIGVIAVLGGLSALYPALVLANFRPALVLAASKTPASGGRLSVRVREGLVVFQFAVVLTFFILSMGFIAQINHLKQRDLGFTPDNLLLITATSDSTLSDAHRQNFWTAVRAIPNVQVVAGSTLAPGIASERNADRMTVPGTVGPAPTIHWTEVGADFFPLYRPHLRAGRLLDQDHGGDILQKTPEAGSASPTNNIVINVSAAARLGFATPDRALDRIVSFSNHADLRIVGVIDDLQFFSPKEKSLAMVYYLNPHLVREPTTSVRFNGTSASAMRAAIAPVWRRFFPDLPFDAVTATDRLDQYYQSDQNRTHLFMLGGAVAVIIGLIGLYGLAAFTTARRSLEVGVRKVMGATRLAIVRLLVYQFVRPVLIANLIAWPTAYFSLQQWRAQFEDALSPDPLAFLLASGVILAIAAGSVAGLAVATARLRPGTVLRQG